MHGLDLDFHRRSSTSSSSSSIEEPPSPYLFGSPLSRVRTRTSSISEPASPLTTPGEEPAGDDHELAKLATRYSLGSPLSRVRTRTDSSCLWEHPPAKRTSTPATLLYEDDFVRLTSSTLSIAHLLFRNNVTLPLSRIHTARPFDSAAERVKRASSLSSSSSNSTATSQSRKRPRLPRGLTSDGLGWTGVIWARDPLRVRDERWQECAIVVNADGWLGRIGFSVERPAEWWAAWEEATGMLVR
ncbi:uncharacterized protein JCM10292_007391 [Rhodotorula paludigena]|uniref:uncharacterized protein n=1 Tax=Rhodotorula paludigena TaxID=86838 RepID=UPI00316EEA16